MRSRWLLCPVMGAIFMLATASPVPGNAGNAARAAGHHMTEQGHAGIQSMMAAYNAALNGSDTAAVLPLYTEGGVFMAPFSQSSIGRDAIKVAYDHVFAELKFDVKFDIAEIVQIAPDWAFVRTNSAGTTLHHSTGKTTSEANQELFVLEKGHDGKWRIARYSFSPTNPPAA